MSRCEARVPVEVVPFGQWKWFRSASQCCQHCISATTTTITATAGCVFFWMWRIGNNNFMLWCRCPCDLNTGYDESTPRLHVPRKFLVPTRAQICARRQSSFNFCYFRGLPNTGLYINTVRSAPSTSHARTPARTPARTHYFASYLRATAATADNTKADGRVQTSGKDLCITV